VRARALYLLHDIAPRDPSLARALRDPVPEVAIAAFRAAVAAGAPPPGASPGLRREAAIALRDARGPRAVAAWLALAGSYRGGDRFLLEALGLGADGKEDAIYAALVARHRDPLAWPAPVADLAWRLHPPAAVDHLAARAAAPRLPLPLRRQALDALAFVRASAAAEAVARLVSTGPEDLRDAARSWLALRAANDWKGYEAARVALDARGAREVAATAEVRRLTEVLLHEKGTPAAREEAALKLAASREGGLALVRLATEQRLAGDLRASVAEVIYRNPDLGVRALASRHFPRPSRTGAAFPSLDQLAAMPGDAARGCPVLASERAGCLRCHRFGAAGQDVGPDLTDIRTKYAKPALLDAVLNPSGAIAFGYEPWLVTLKSGETLTGFLLADGDPLVLKDIAGERRTLPAATIASKSKEALSIMPDNISIGLEPQELVDLVACLIEGPGKR
jgi:putative heme-binding domain-containing protein